MINSSLIIIFLMISHCAVECIRDAKKLTIIAHGTNDLQSIEWAITAGANAIEGDLQFNPTTGEPTIFYHGEPCDCTCYDLTLSNTEGTVCSFDVCNKSTPSGEWLSFLLGFPTLAMIYIDSKTQEMSDSVDVQRLAASKVVRLVETKVFDKGFKGNVLIGSELEKDYLAAVAAHAKESVYASQIFLTYDEGKVGPTTKLEFLNTLSYPNIVYTAGMSACFEKFNILHILINIAAEYRDKGVFSDVIVWSLDTIEKFESYYYVGARGFITNNVAEMAKWAKLKGLQLAQPGDSTNKNKITSAKNTNDPTVIINKADHPTNQSELTNQIRLTALNKFVQTRLTEWLKEEEEEGLFTISG